MGAYTGHKRSHCNHRLLGTQMPAWQSSLLFVMRYDAPAYWHLTLHISMFIITFGRSFGLPRFPVLTFSEQHFIFVRRVAPNISTIFYLFIAPAPLPLFASFRFLCLSEVMIGFFNAMMF